MKFKTGPCGAAGVVLAGGLALYLVADHVGSAAAVAEAPATVSGHVVETDLLTIRLNVDAERRLGIETVAVARMPAPRSRLYGGEVVLPPRAAGGEVGVAYATGSSASLYQFADARIAAEARERQTAAQRDGARKTLERAERMLKDESGSQRAVEEARTALAVAEADHQAASAQRELLGRSARTTGLERVWVRTPVFGGDIATINAAGAARVGALNEANPSRYREARPVRAPHTADPTAGTMDMYYEVPDANGTLLPGQRVNVLVPLAGDAESLVVPWAAVLHDIYGGTWVYERVAERTYTRRRIQVSSVTGDTAVLRSGPTVGAAIVTAGAAELFGTEFGVGH